MPTSRSSAAAPAAARRRKFSPRPDSRWSCWRRGRSSGPPISGCANRKPIRELYQDSAARKTRDKAINILQGRCVGGGTTVNWTSSFRTPPATLACWQREFGLSGFTVDDLAPWFAQMEARLSIGPWEVAPNANNEALARGAKRIGISASAIRRNVIGCWNLGYCGMGCPINAKQSMLVTTIPAALANGATLVTRVRARSASAAGRSRVAARRQRDERAGRSADAAQRARARPGIRHGGRRDRHAGTSLAQRRARSPRHPGQAHVPASGRRFGRAHARPRRRLRRRAADHLLRPLPRHAADRRSAGLQARGAAAASGADRNHAAGRRRRARALDAGLPADAGPDRAASRRLPSGKPGRDRAACATTARRSSTTRCCRCSGMARGARCARWRRSSSPPARRPSCRCMREGAAFTNFADARAAIDAFALQPLVTPVVSAHVMGGAPLGPDPKTRGRREQRPPPPGREPVCVRRLAVSDVDRRQSAAVDLRHRRAARDGPRAGTRAAALIAARRACARHGRD